jgi:hypothetical protein
MIEIPEASPVNPFISICMLLTILATALIQKNVKVTIPVRSTLNLSLMNKKIRLKVRMAKIIISLYKAAFRYHF